MYLLALLVIVAALLFAADRSPTGSLFGYRYYIVLTNSMVPEFSSGDVVVVHIQSAQHIEVGDIITFSPSPGSDAYLTHRVTQKLENYEGTQVTCFRTQGDANNAEDPFVIGEDQIVGTVAFHVPKLGTAIRFVQLRWYYVVPLLLVAAVTVAGSTFAWFTSQDEVTNRLSASADFNTTIYEDFTPKEDWTPGESVKKEVGAINTGSVDSFVRMWLTGEMKLLAVDTDGTALFSGTPAALPPPLPTQPIRHWRRRAGQYGRKALHRRIAG